MNRTVLTVGSNSIVAVEMDGYVLLSDLRGSGDPADLRRLVRAVQKLATQMPVFLEVHYDNPKKEKIMKFYEKCGAHPRSILMEVVP